MKVEIVLVSGKAVEYYDIVNVEYVRGIKALKIGLETGRNSRDRHNEYIVLTNRDGETYTFCASVCSVNITIRRKKI